MCNSYYIFKILFIFKKYIDEYIEKLLLYITKLHIFVCLITF